MTDIKKPLGITDVVLRDAHQSLFATRMRIDDMLPIAEKLDQVGYWSLESWGGATFDSCIRFLGEDPWDRIREFKKAMPNTKQQMLLRGQNLLGYRHYADDVVNKFVERAATNGVDVFRVFDAMNDPRNLETAIKAVKANGKHAQGTLSYTTSPVHNLDAWLSLAKQIEDLGADSIAIKDMAGIINPYEAFELVSRLKKETDLEVQLHCHATAGMSDMAILKAIEAGVDRVDTAISSMSGTYGHSATETVVAAMQGTDRDTGIDLLLLEEIAAYFRNVRKKYSKFEGALRGTDSRILVAQVPGGMLTNMESQLKEQGAGDKMDEVLLEIPKVREDLGFIPLVTPTSQIVGTQSVINVLTGERYKTISKETAGVLKGEYGATAAPVNAELQLRVLDGNDAITCRPADQIDDELAVLTKELTDVAEKESIQTAENLVDDVLTYALFPQIGLKFLKNRNNPDAFEPVPTEKPQAETQEIQTSGTASAESYSVRVDGQVYEVEVAPSGSLTNVQVAANPAVTAQEPATDTPQAQGQTLNSPLAGNIFKVLVNQGDAVNAGDVVIIMEAMKMETEIRASGDGVITSITTKEGDAVKTGQPLLVIG